MYIHIYPFVHSFIHSNMYLSIYSYNTSTILSSLASVDLISTPTITSQIGQDINYKTITILTACVMGGLLFLLLSVIASLLLVIIIHHKRHKAKKRNGETYGRLKNYSVAPIYTRFYLYFRYQTL